MRVAVTGSRHRPFEKKDLIWDALDHIHKYEFNIHLLVQGGARGVDELAKLWCLKNGLPCAQVDAHWNYYGKYQAGPVRNYWMANLFSIDWLIAFPGGTGTANMIGQAQKYGISVRFVKEDSDFVNCLLSEM